MDDDFDNDSDNDNRMSDLYNRFRQFLANGHGLSYFDEQDFVDIFDYAGDMGDQYVKLEVLQLGVRFFPKSDDLLKRRAIFLLNIDETAFCNFIDDNCPADSDDPLWIILLNRRLQLRGDDAVRALDDFIKRFRLDDDESIIQFVALARAWQQDRWLLENLDRIRPICCSEATLMFEIGRLAETTAEIDLSVKLLEELTMADPFNLEYWGLLADLQAHAGQLDEARNSVEYGMAVDPHNADLLSLKGYIELSDGRYEQARTTLSEAFSISPDNYDIRRNLFEAEYVTQNYSAALQLGRELFAQYPNEEWLMKRMLEMSPDESDDILAEYFTAIGPSDGSIINLVNSLCEADNPKMALKVLRWYGKTYGLSPQCSHLLIHILYVNGEYEEAYNCLNSGDEPMLLASHELPLVAVIASLLVKVRHLDDARTFSLRWMEKLGTATLQPGNLANVMVQGLVTMLYGIHEQLTRPEGPDMDALDKLLL